jgi:effector-binding domain-containing protein
MLRRAHSPTCRIATIGPMQAVVGLTLVLMQSAGCYREGRTLSPAEPDTSIAVGPLSRPVLPPLSQPSYTVTDPVRQTLPGVDRFVYVTSPVTFAALTPMIARAFGELEQASASGRFVPAGPPMLIYYEVPGDPEKPFQIEIGFPAAPGDPLGGNLKERVLPPMEAMNVDFTGPLSAIDKAYDRVLPAARSAGALPNGETRETYLKFGGAAAPDNVVRVSVRIPQK